MLKRRGKLFRDPNRQHVVGFCVVSIYSGNRGSGFAFFFGQVYFSFLPFTIARINPATAKHNAVAAKAIPVFPPIRFPTETNTAVKQTKIRLTLDNFISF